MIIHLVLIGAIGLLLLPNLVHVALVRLGMVANNFQGDCVPVGFGLAILLWSAPALILASQLVPDLRAEHLAMAAIVAGFALLGFVDDRWGDRTTGGLIGHIHRLVREGVFTTGLLKLVGGASLAFAIPWQILHRSWPAALLDGALIALSANAVNLFDLRPGRASALFLVAALPLTAVLWSEASPPALLWVTIPALTVYERDARARAMMGDTGSNLLGSALGLSITLLDISLLARVAILGCLIALHVAAERRSLSRIIEGSAILCKLDRMTGHR